MTDVEILGIEGGGSHTVAVVLDQSGKFLRRSEFAPGNVRLLSIGELQILFRDVARFCSSPAAIGAGLAGVRDESDREKVGKAITSTWGRVPSLITHDLAVALATAEEVDGSAGKVLVLSGTGSCCYGESATRIAKVGGWGHILGDAGSGYAIGHQALREIIYEFDRKQRWTSLGRRVLETLLLNEPNDLIGWVQRAPKSEVAALARQVLENRSDPIAANICARAAESLARDAVICAGRLAPPTTKVTFVLAGGVLLKQPSFARRVASLIRREWPAARITTLQKEGAWGAAEMARGRAAAETSLPKKTPTHAVQNEYYIPEFIPGSSPTEQRNPASTRFNKLSIRKMVDVMLEAEQNVVPALLRERRSIIRAVEMAVETLKRGGRIFYAGAGTSGRLGVLDASECPPTFRASPEMIQGIIAGGQRALWQAVEGAEDNAAAGAEALRFRGLQARDLLIGIAASGRTPFVWGALGYAKGVGARTVLLCFNPSLEIERGHRPDLVIAPNLGAEILTGSTRLKSGTATKLVLNAISTIAMVRLGKVISNLMVDLNPSNIKLRDRAVRIVQELTGCAAAAARTALEKNGWVVKDAWAALQKGR